MTRANALTVGGCAGLLLLLAGSPSLAGQTESGAQFSAEMFDQQNPGKVYVGKNRVRMEPSAGGARGVTIIDLVTGHQFVLMAESHTYVDVAVGVDISKTVGPFPRPADLTRPCAEMVAARRELTRQEGQGDELTCKNLGPDTVNNRRAQKWEVHDAGDTGYLWVDAALHLIIKLQGPGTLVELRNIKEEPQPDALFEIPPSYKKVDVGDLNKPSPSR